MTAAAAELFTAAGGSSRARARAACALAFLAVLPIVVGAQVTTTLSGDSVPQWPSSFYVPANPKQFWELVHRWTAGTVGVCTIAMAVWVCVAEGSRRGVSRLAIATGIGVVAQALLGGLRIHAGNGGDLVLVARIAVTHTVLGQSFVAALAVLAAVQASSWISAAPAVATPLAVTLTRRAKMLVAAVWCQALLGAILRHITQDRDVVGLTLHLVGAAVVVVLAALVVSGATDLPEATPLRAPARALGILVAAQLALGLGAWLTTHLSTGYARPDPTSPLSLVPSLHVLVGAAILSISAVMALRAARHLKPAVAA